MILTVLACLFCEGAISVFGVVCGEGLSRLFLCEEVTIALCIASTPSVCVIRIPAPSRLPFFLRAPFVVSQAVFASLRSHLDFVALTEEVPRLRKYLTRRFAAPNGVLTAEVEAKLERESVS